jgi:hypothetical protein
VPAVAQQGSSRAIKVKRRGSTRRRRYSRASPEQLD